MLFWRQSNQQTASLAKKANKTESEATTEYTSNNAIECVFSKQKLPPVYSGIATDSPDITKTTMLPPIPEAFWQIHLVTSANINHQQVR